MIDLLLTVLLSGYWIQQPSTSSPATTVPAYVPERVYETRRGAFSDFEVMLIEFAKADVVLVGEQHDDPNTHRLETAILDGLARRNAPVVVSLEMFERDVQGSLDEYLAGRIDEDTLLKQSRPWPRYATDYRSLVELAKARTWPVVAANVPRKYASLVAKSGLGALDSLPPDERAFAARELRCPVDSYFERFAATMDNHPVPGSEKLSEAERRATTERYYHAQCLKDETMAESIVRAIERQPSRQGPVVHFNGAFHSDFGAGVAERVTRRLPDRRVVVVTILPVKDLDSGLLQGEDMKRAEFLVYTIK